MLIKTREAQFRGTSILLAEGRSLRYVENAVLQISFNKIIIEGDSQIAILVLNAKTQISWQIPNIIEDAQT